MQMLLAHSAYAGDIETIAFGAKAINKERFTPLHSAASEGHIDAIMFLLAQGADVNALDSTGRTPLSSIYHGRYIQAMELLLDHGAEMNTINSYGRSYLHDAAVRGRNDMIEVLVANGADVGATTENGETPLQLYRGSDERVRALLSLCTEKESQVL